MHPVIADAVYPFAEQVATVSLSEAQVSPDPEHRRWCGQQVVEHLILAFDQSEEELQRRLKSGASPVSPASPLQWILKIQVCILSSMSRGVSSTLALRPSRFVPQDGEALAARFLAAVERLNNVLADCRIAFGLRRCGYHPMYGPLRVEEWRVYHAVHCRHHLRQFEEAIRIARKRTVGTEQGRLEVRQAAPRGGDKGTIFQ